MGASWPIGICDVLLLDVKNKELRTAVLHTTSVGDSDACSLAEGLGYYLKGVQLTKGMTGAPR